MRYWLATVLAAMPTIAAAQELPMTREGLDSALTQYFAGADRNGDGKLDRAETAAVMGFTRSMLTGKRDEEPFVMDVGPDGRPRLTLNENGPLSQGGMADMLYKRTDTNGDGALSVAEVQTAGREAFDLADRDGDGILDDAERAAAQKKIGLLSNILG
ncbi:EF-hand domain-containing protein [Sphingomonas sp. SRS2]|uniref:EF-hand domain-containing protein n=1 Tax=Sphingomonas sp. SRS2 TaxID=133190 RepID=UPI0006184DC2|nr:hypothetical protein [Sphingomonas sp. SRS2]KKC27745.1 hypothetical protein WP12_01600 [Sphingomonas sp. SRS2]